MGNDLGRPGGVPQRIARAAYSLVLSDIFWEELLAPKISQFHGVGVKDVDMSTPLSNQAFENCPADATASDQVNASISETFLVKTGEFLLAGRGRRNSVLYLSGMKAV